MKEATLQVKIAQVEEVAAKMNDSQSSVVVDVIGLTVADKLFYYQSPSAVVCSFLATAEGFFFFL